ncbi:N-acetylglucosamine-6-phosphate deacetylase [Amaricoccus macauensis]|uniref:N-acetylglucosamine-6-phosphate deacetylase n=1 Tax=Amaricoccus macauensis TaxID=57001 RepID=A0A840SQY9_9RHOB|nr:N-acetylglucosamine-6-phosphate deacetylase [Amaricoccus macauensis]MBB5224487.1 N-acetylglucosamine-6-phosphate deacetylase [Amaricoccus macauensis]
MSAATAVTVFTGAAVFDGDRLHEDAALVVEDGRITAIVPAAEAPDGARVELDGGTLAPGFIDIQVNGGAGILLNDKPDVEGIAAICAAHGRLGTTGLLPTLITDTPQATRATIEAGVTAAGSVPGFLGLHLEGPHLDLRRKGAHDPRLIRPMTPDDLDMLCDAAARLPALVVTLAPASATAEQVAALVEARAIVSLGHSEATLAEARALFGAGARMVTHLFNAMSQLGNREPGLVGATLDDAGVSAGLIADGIHVAPESMRAALAAKRGTDSVFLVTDAMAPAGTDITEFTLNGRRILRRDGRLTLEDGTLAGADVDFPGVIRVMVRDVGLTLPETLRMATYAPAAALRATDRMGRLAPGLAADLVHLDADLALGGVWRGGAPLD